MTHQYQTIDSLLALLDHKGVRSIPCLRLLVFLITPRSNAEIEDVIGIERNTLREMVKRCPDLMFKQTLPVDPENRQRGKPPIQYSLTPEGKRLVSNLFAHNNILPKQ